MKDRKKIEKILKLFNKLDENDAVIVFREILSIMMYFSYIMQNIENTEHINNIIRATENEILKREKLI